MAETPDLPGCRAWGDMAAQALENVQSVAAEFIESYRSRGAPLPLEVEATSTEPNGTEILGEVLAAG